MTVMHEFEIVHYVAEQWYVLLYTKVREISHLNIYMCIYNRLFDAVYSQIVHVKYSVST